MRTHQAHALGVDEPVTVDPPEAHVLPGLDVDRLVDSGHIREGGRLVERGGGWGLQWAEAHEVVHLRRGNICRQQPRGERKGKFTSEGSSG